MKIYKFKDLRNKANHSHFFDILIYNKIWCASPDSLNDENEFRFSMNYSPTSKTAELLTKNIAMLGSGEYPPSMVAAYAVLHNQIEHIAKPIISNVIEKCRSTIGITSFSASATAEELWSEYGGKGNGVVVEFELPDHELGNRYHPVKYVSEKIFHVDVFLEAQLGSSSEVFKQMLCTKTTNWAQENEIRYLAKIQNVGIEFDIPITNIILGKKCDSDCVIEIMKLCKKSGVSVINQKS